MAKKLLFFKRKYDSICPSKYGEFTDEKRLRGPDDRRDSDGFGAGFSIDN